MSTPKSAHPASFPVPDNTIHFPKKDQAARTVGKLEQLVTIEGEIRNLPTRAALGIFAVNEPRDLVGFDQAFLITFTRRGRAKVEAASSVAGVDPQAPLVRDICILANAQFKAAKSMRVDLSVLGNAHGYPYIYGFWVPLVDSRKGVFGGLLYASGEQWSDASLSIADRVATTCGHALRALSPPRLLRTFSLPRWLSALLLFGAACLIFLPVPLTVLAPFEVVAAKPQIVTSPLDGAIASIEVPPSSNVVQGQVLFRFDTTTLQADANIAAEKARVAAAKLETAQNGAFGAEEYRNSLGILEKEFDLAQIEHAYAETLLKRANVSAERSGVVLYSTSADLIGKPVQVGEKVMEIADPKHVAYRISVGVHDSIALQTHFPARLFFDSDPLHPMNAGITELSYHATPQPDGQLTYQVLAESDENATPPRIGVRGTAQISGQTVSLGFYLLRRPIAAFRQTLGL